MEEHLLAVERELCRIPEVNAVRIVGDDTGRPIEVHIVASPIKHPKQIVRDVQSVAMATFGLDLDRRIISVVQLDSLTTEERSSASRERSARIVIDAVTALRNGTHCSAQVSLRRWDDRAVGVADGVLVSGSALRLVARATLSALRELESAAARADIETVMLVHLGERQAAVASVVFAVPPYEEVVAGSAIVRAAGEHDAVVRAVLDATNRRLTQLSRT